MADRRRDEILVVMPSTWPQLFCRLAWSNGKKDTVEGSEERDSRPSVENKRVGLDSFLFLFFHLLVLSILSLLALVRPFASAHCH